VVLASGASADDVCDIISYTAFEVNAQTFTGTTTMDVAAITGVLTANGGAVFNEGSADVDFRVESNGNPNMLFVDGGNDAVVIGHNNANDGSVSSAFSLQNIGTSYNSSSIGLARFSADVNAPALAFHKSRNASIGGDTVVADNDELGRIRFFGNDGTDFAEGARITALVNGTPGGGDMPTELVFSTSADGAESPTARMTIDSSGNLLVGKTSSDTSTAGIELRATDELVVTRAGNPASLNRIDSDGSILTFKKDETAVGSIGVLSSDNVYFGGSPSGHAGLIMDGSSIVPLSALSRSDNTISLGDNSFRFDDIFATNGTIQTSDRNEKQDIASLTSAEMLVAKRISALFKTFRWKDKVAEKGDNARTHTGIIAQDVQSAFTDEGLDAGDYSLFISSTWWEHDVNVPAVEAADAVTDEDGNVTTEAVEAVDAYTRTDIYDTEDEAPEGAVKKTRMGIRYPELLSFVAAYNEQRFAAIETRLTALEG